MTMTNATTLLAEWGVAEKCASMMWFSLEGIEKCLSGERAEQYIRITGADEDEARKVAEESLRQHKSRLAACLKEAALCGDMTGAARAFVDRCREAIG